jgi:hypothetical protein
MNESLPENGFVIVAKRDCHTCEMIQPVMRSLDRAGSLTVFTQDDPTFPEGVSRVVDDHDLERSFHLKVETVPTLIRYEGGRETGRTFGWDRSEWVRLAGQAAAGEGLPAWQPGCGSKSVEPGIQEHLIARYGDPGLKAREIAIGEWDDPMEACFERGWSDGLPVVPPTDERILRMLGGTERSPSEIVGLSSRPTWRPARSRRWRSTRCWRAASRNTCRWCWACWKQPSIRCSSCTGSCAPRISRARWSSSMVRSPNRSA